MKNSDKKIVRFMVTCIALSSLWLCNSSSKTDSVNGACYIDHKNGHLHDGVSKKECLEITSAECGKHKAQLATTNAAAMAVFHSGKACSEL